MASPRLKFFRKSEEKGASDGVVTVLVGCKTVLTMPLSGMKKTFPLVFAGVLALVFASCAPSTPEYRISERPRVFEGLNTKEKALVRNGEISKGMSMDAVALAWGSPSERVDGLRDGKRMERWDYEGTKPVVTNRLFGGYDTGWYGPYRYSGVGGGFGPEITYIPYRKSSVRFVGGRVDEWERIK